ncbi:DUF1441 family protein [bacterium]|jgi:hypothetical protein|nr:DUF1441 family protein [bacterium]MDB4745815.1 DUF1441 family protein [Verrucomicrobiota bacterium]MDB4798299.1 DUF1441 family protein [Verrucomicrobiota bacterium]
MKDNITEWMPQAESLPNPTPSNSPKEGLSVPELAKSFDKSIPTIRHYVSNLQPVGKRNKSHLYSLADVRKVFEEAIHNKGKSGSRAKLEEQKLDLQCQRLQIDIDERLGKLLPVDEVRRHFATHTSAVTTHTRRLGGEIAPLLQGLSVAKMEKKINESQEEMIAKIRETPYDD